MRGDLRRLRPGVGGVREAAEQFGVPIASFQLVQVEISAERSAKGRAEAMLSAILLNELEARDVGPPNCSRCFAYSTDRLDAAFADPHASGGTE